MEDKNLDYEHYFFGIAHLAALRSPYDSKKGCCIVDKINRIVGIGWNGWPRGQTYQIEGRGEGPKHQRTETYACHSEANAIVFRTGEVSGGRLYSTDLPCDLCAKLIVQCGIEEVHYDKDINSVSNRWIFSKRKNMKSIDDKKRSIEGILLTQNCSFKLNNPKEELRFTIQESRIELNATEDEDSSLWSSAQPIKILINPQLCVSIDENNKEEIIPIEEIEFTAQINDNEKLESGSIIERKVKKKNCIYVIGNVKLDNITLKEIIEKKDELDIDFCCDKTQLKLKVKVNKIKIREKWINPGDLISTNLDLNSINQSDLNSINQSEISTEPTTVSFILEKDSETILKKLNNSFRLRIKNGVISAMKVELLTEFPYKSLQAPSGKFNAKIIGKIKIKRYSEIDTTERELEDYSAHVVKLKISEKIEHVRLIQEDSGIKNTISLLKKATNYEEEE